jgi:hypothetical protein
VRIHYLYPFLICQFSVLLPFPIFSYEVSNFSIKDGVLKVFVNGY